MGIRRLFRSSDRDDSKPSKNLTRWDGYIVGVSLRTPSSGKGFTDNKLVHFHARVDLVPSSGEHIEVDLGDGEVQQFEVMRVVHTLERSGRPNDRDYGFAARSVTLVVQGTNAKPLLAYSPPSTYARPRGKREGSS